MFLPRPGRRRVGIRELLVLLAILIVIALIRTHGGVAHDEATTFHAELNAPLVGGRMPATIVLPAGSGKGRPLLVFLFGKGGNQNSELNPAMYAALKAQGARAPDIVFPGGNSDSYWHDRASGKWASYVLDEVIPWALKQSGADPHRIAIGGISMGGFGAYDIARLSPAKFCAVGGHSAAMWPAAADTAPGAFDNAADFARNDVIADAKRDPHLYGTASLWLDGGSADPFHAADSELALALHIPLHVWPGGHDSAYWNAHWGAYLHFYATALASAQCRARDRSS